MSQRADDDEQSTPAPCPRCGLVLYLNVGELCESVCAHCRGRFLPPSAVEHLVHGQLGISMVVLRELAGHFAGPRLTCPECRSFMNPMKLRNIPLDVCLGCGGLWCDAGEFLRLSEGRYQEIQPTQPAPEPPDPTPASAPPLGPGGAPAPTFAVFREEATPLAVEQVAPALRAVCGLTLVDVRGMARDPSGVLAHGLSEDHARELCRQLMSAGVKAHAVMAQWMQLPRAQRVLRMEPQEDGLMVMDEMQRTLRMPWRSIRVVSAGMVGGFSELKLVKTAHVVRRRRGQVEVVPAEHDLQEQDRALLDVLTDGERVRAAVDDLLNRLVDVQRPGDRLAGAAVLLKEVRHRAADVQWNAGAQALLHGQRRLTGYPTVRLFEREQSWLWWRSHAFGPSPP